MGNVLIMAVQYKGKAICNSSLEKKIFCYSQKKSGWETLFHSTVHLHLPILTGHSWAVAGKVLVQRPKSGSLVVSVFKLTSFQSIAQINGSNNSEPPLPIYQYTSAEDISSCGPEWFTFTTITLKCFKELVLSHLKAIYLNRLRGLPDQHTTVCWASLPTWPWMLVFHRAVCWALYSTLVLCMNACQRIAPTS